VLPRGLRRGQLNFRSHNSCFSLGASSPGRRCECVLFGVSFRVRYSPTGLPGDTVWLAIPPAGWGWLDMLSHFLESCLSYFKQSAIARAPGSAAHNRGKRRSPAKAGTHNATRSGDKRTRYGKALASGPSVTS